MFKRSSESREDARPTSAVPGAGHTSVVTNLGEQDILAVLDSDHDGLIQQVQAASAAGDASARAAACEQLVMQMVRHFVAEEQYLLPLYEEHLDGGAALAKAELDEHRGIEQRLRALEEMESSAEAVVPVLADITAALREHIDAQGVQFEALRSRCEPETLAELGEKVRGAEQVAPTRPRHAHPDSAALNKVVSLISGFVDRTRDAYTHRGVRGE